MRIGCWIGLLFLSPVMGLAQDSSTASSETVTVSLPPGPGPIENPLKGCCQYPNLPTPWGKASMVFHYASWKALEPSEGAYALDAWEADAWNQPEHADKHVVLRVFIDYPRRESGLPDWMTAKGVTQKPYDDHGGGMSPDYDHPAMLAGMKRLISVLGERYNANPRVAFIQLGMLGHWGEWHTYPRNELFASAETQREVIDTFRQAFPDKHLMARTADGYAGTLAWMGYHDDMFPQDTDNGRDWSFLAKIRGAGRDQNWLIAPIGGEMVPGEAKKWLTDEFATTMQMVERSHFSWIGPYGPLHTMEPTPELVQNYESLIRRMGYEFRLSHFRHPREIRIDDSRLQATFRVDLRGDNQGVAPFYFNWPVQFALLDRQDQVLGIGETTWDVRQWQPGRPFVEQAAVRFEMLDRPTSRESGPVRLAVGIIDPWKRTPRIEFANDLPVVNGWTVLSEIRLLR